MTTPTKKPAKKAPATKKAGRRNRTARPRRAPELEQRGRPPLVLTGFAYNPPAGVKGHKATQPVGARWAPGSHADQVLRLLSAGLTWKLAAEAAEVHEDTPGRWNKTGRDAFIEALELGVESLADYHEHTPDEEAFAYVAFHLAATAAVAAPVANALVELNKATAQAVDGDWRAAAHVLKVLPAARDYREVTKQEVTGADGAPLLGSDSTQLMLALAERFADAPPADDDG